MLKQLVKFVQLGVPLPDLFRFKNKKVSGLYKTQLFGKPILINHPFWYLHSLEELFIEQTYNFTTDNTTPYIIDCGANLGLSIIYFKKRFPGCKILAFEADKNIFSILKSNVEVFDFNDVELISGAVWSKDTLLDFSVDGALGGTVSELGINTNKSLTVEARSLASFLEGKQVDFLKMDIEGAEFEVLNACRDNLGGVRTLFVEYHSGPNRPQMLPEILEIIKSAGFRFYIKEAWKNMEHPFLEHYKPFYYDLQLNIFCYR